MIDPQDIPTPSGTVVIIGLDASEVECVTHALRYEANRLRTYSPERAQQCEFLAHRIQAIREALNKGDDQ